MAKCNCDPGDPSVTGGLHRDYCATNIGNESSGIETYRVGLFSDLNALRINRALRRFEGAGSQRHPWGWFVRSFRRSWRRRSYWNGYLAEWHYCPQGVRHTRCGRGWTRRAALRRLGAHLVASNLLGQRAARG